MGKLLVLLSLIYLYFNVNEYLVPGYKMKEIEGDQLKSLFVREITHLCSGRYKSLALLYRLSCFFSNGAKADTHFYHINCGCDWCLVQTYAYCYTYAVAPFYPDSKCATVMASL